MIDPRRRFNKREQSALYRLADGRCTECGVELEPGWHSDHITPHSRGGATDVINGQALCPPCNLKKGNRMPISPRRWQRQFLDKYTAYTPADFLVVACPGAGKTLAAGLAVRDLLHDGVVDRVLIVVPTAPLREQWRKALAKLGICVDEATANNTHGEMATIDGTPTQGWVVTYQSLAADPLIHRMLNDKRRTIAVLDEVHHLSADGGAWGRAARDALDPCVRRLSLSGTPFRGDKTRIPFVEYETTPDGGQQCRYKDAADGTPYPYGFDYSYGVALTDDPPPVRPVVFEHYDGDVEWMGWDDKKPVRVRLSGEIKNKVTRSRANRHVLHRDSEWLSTVLRDADGRLRMVRAEGDPRGKGLVICLDTGHADAVANRLREITGERVFTAVSKDESGRDVSEQARTTIENFGASDAKWLVAVQMVTEGVDIPELRVAVYATVVRSPLFFRQVVGRVVRLRDDLPADVDQTSYLFVPKEPTMLQLADSVQDEVTGALVSASDEDERAGDGGEGPERTPRDEPTLPFDPFREATADDVGVLVPGHGHIDAERVREVVAQTGHPFGVVAAVLAAGDRIGCAAEPAVSHPVEQEKPRDRIKRRQARLETLIRQYTGLLLRLGQGQEDYGRTISRLKTNVYEAAGIYTPNMSSEDKKAAYARADLPAVDMAIAYVQKLMGEW